MRTVSYKSVQDMIAGFLGWDPNNLSADEQGQINRAVNRRGQFAWEAFFWPEWTLVERRTFRPAWDGVTAFTAGAQVIDLASKAYFIALTANTNQPPTDANLVVNLAFWGVLQSGYGSDAWCDGPSTFGTASAVNFSLTTIYTQGSRVYYPPTDSYYQLFAASSVGNLPTDATRWGLLVPFVRNIAYAQAGQTVIGDVKQPWCNNPRTNPRSARPLNFVMEDDGVRVLGTDPVVYLEFRLQTPGWVGPLWVAGNYAAGAQVYFNGDYYAALQPATTQDPTNPAYWALIGLPYVISKYVANGAYADVDAKAEGEKAAFPSENDEAYGALEFEFDKLERQQQQTTQMNVVQHR